MAQPYYPIRNRSVGRFSAWGPPQSLSIFYSFSHQMAEFGRKTINSIYELIYNLWHDFCCTRKDHLIWIKTTNNRRFERPLQQRDPIWEFCVLVPAILEVC